MAEECIIDDRLPFPRIDWTKSLDENIEALREFLMYNGNMSKEEADIYLEESIKKLKEKDAV